jgi:hypothetical protein
MGESWLYFGTKAIACGHLFPAASEKPIQAESALRPCAGASPIWILSNFCPGPAEWYSGAVY